MSNQRPKCRVCLTHVLETGECRYKCDPKLARPSRRKNPKGAKPEKSAITITHEERKRISEIMHKQDPLLIKYSNTMHRRRMKKDV